MRKISPDEFVERWAVQHEEWQSIAAELEPLAPTAYDVTLEQRVRALRGGRTLVTMIGDEPHEVTPAEDAKLSRCVVDLHGVLASDHE